MTHANQESSEWQDRVDLFCRAWSSEVGVPDFATLAELYASDPDITIYDTLPPLEGFQGFDHMRVSIYPSLALVRVRRTGPVKLKSLCDGQVVVTSYPFHLTYGYADNTRHEISARISEVWERRDSGYVIVHEHPSTTYDLPARPHQGSEKYDLTTPSTGRQCGSNRRAFTRFVSWSRKRLYGKSHLSGLASESPLTMESDKHGFAASKLSLLTLSGSLN